LLERTLQSSDHQQFFSTAFVDKNGEGQQPFDYQRRLALDQALPSPVNVATDAGKTAIQVS